MFIAPLFRTAKIWKQPKCPFIDELRFCIYKHWDILFSVFLNLVICKNVDRLRGVMLNEMSDRKRWIPYVLTYMWNLEKKQISRYKCIANINV